MKTYQALMTQRYLRSRVVNVLAVLAVLIGVAALIIVSSVMDGFARDIQDRIRGIMSHVVVEGEQLIGISDYERLIDRIESVPEVAACAPLVECPIALIRVGNRPRPIQIRGIDMEREKRTSEIDTYRQQLWDWVEQHEDEYRERRGELIDRLLKDEPLPPERPRGGLDLRRFEVGYSLRKRDLNFRYDDGGEPEHPGALGGIELARYFGLRRGEVISVTAPSTSLTVETRRFTVVGGFECRHHTYDDQLIYVPLLTAQNLVGLPGAVTSISVRLKDVERAEEAKPAIAQAIQNPTAILDPADPADLARLESPRGTYELEPEPGATWINVVPDEREGETAGRIVIREVDAALKKADGPKLFLMDLRQTEVNDPRRIPNFELCLVDSLGQRHYPDPENRSTNVGRTPGETHAYPLANFLSSDGLSPLEPTDIRRIEIAVRRGPIAFANLRFQDHRRVAVRTWRDKRKNFLAAVEIEKRVVVIIVALLVVVAGFSIMAILWLMVKEKTRDIGILMSLGATRGGIVRIFLLNGLLIGFIGGILGLITGWVVSANLNVIEAVVFEWTGWRPFPPEIYYLDKLPHVENPANFALMAFSALMMSLVAALWPAIKASRLDPVEALRYE